jgi:fatty acid hydroxylase domain-containing protein 2
MSTIILYHWILGGIFLVFDLTQWPKCLKKYKIQPGTNEPVNLKNLRAAIFVIICNQFFINYGSVFFVVGFLNYFQLWDLVKLNVPSFVKFYLDLIGCCIIYEIIFYYNHRLLHHKWIYKYIHKIHHRWKAPIALASQYCHPFEHFFCNVVPMAGFIILQTEVCTALFFNLYIITHTIFEHCGLHLPFMQSPEVHDYHHKTFNECFSTNGLMDQLHGTCTTFIAAKVIEKHKTLMQFEPFARENERNQAILQQTKSESNENSSSKL